MTGVWEIIGGGDTGGIRVRMGVALTSSEAHERLSTGATVEELDRKGDRLKYKLRTGTGPVQGWISIKTNSKDLARRVQPVSDAVPAAPQLWAAAAGSGERPAAGGVERAAGVNGRGLHGGSLAAGPAAGDRDRDASPASAGPRPSAAPAVLPPAPTPGRASSSSTPVPRHHEVAIEAARGAKATNGHAEGSTNFDQTLRKPADLAGGPGGARSAEDGAAAVGAHRERGPPTTPDDDRGIEGSWLYTQGEAREVYEICSLEDAGARGPGREDGAGGACSPAAPPETKLWYFQRASSGDVLRGPLGPSEDPQWHWEAAVGGGARVRLRHETEGYDVTRLIRTYMPPDGREWQVPCVSEPPQAYAFYNASDHLKGYRYVHVCGRSAAEFPLVGLTAGWLPVTLLGSDRQNDTRKRVRFECGFWDPFDAFIAVGGRPSVAMREVPTHTVQTVARTKGGACFFTPPKGGKGGKFGKGRPAGHFFDSISRGRGGKGAMYYPRQVVQHRLMPIEGQAFFKNDLRPLKGAGYQSTLEKSVPASLTRQGGQLPPRPVLSILCVRWFDYWSDGKHSDYSVLNDGYMTDLFGGAGSVDQRLPGQYEVYSVFVRQTRDLTRLDPLKLRLSLKGKKVVTWYFVWPTHKDHTTDSTFVGGFVGEEEFFKFVYAMERLPCPTGWPHEVSLYRQLCGKLWIPQMCLNRKYRVPPTTRMHYAEFMCDNRKAATRALECIMNLRKVVWSRAAVPFDTFRGVVKLGFSWGGLDVLPFTGLVQLVSKLKKLFDGRKCQNTICLVQELIPGVVGEHRIVCFWDERNRRFVKEPVWMQSIKPAGGDFDPYDFKLASANVCQPKEAARKFFGGDSIAWSMAEKEAEALADRWLLWYRTESPKPPQCTRIDFLVTHPGASEAAVWTCEVGECGASLCSVEVEGRNAVALNTAMRADPTGRFPLPLPDKMPRNSGWKS